MLCLLLRKINKVKSNEFLFLVQLYVLHLSTRLSFQVKEIIKVDYFFFRFALHFGPPFELYYHVSNYCLLYNSRLYFHM
jgi:hypothetical protein